MPRRKMEQLELFKMTDDQLREMVINELRKAGWNIEVDQQFSDSPSNEIQNLRISPPTYNGDKEAIRLSHYNQRIERSRTEINIVHKYGQKLLGEFASGSEINPEKFKPVLYQVDSKSDDNILFRFSTLLWSVPVSKGYGRRMRYIIRDEYNGKIVGIFALMDPVFNLGVRDQHIGWNKNQRLERLYNVMDAYILGAVPPYNTLLGGKMVALAVVSNEIRQDFRDKYQGLETIIKKAKKDPALTLITTTSALGRSSIYNRIQLPNETERVYQSLGFSRGWGHYHFSEENFIALRTWLKKKKDPYADGYTWNKEVKGASGPNWRMRVIRKSLSLLGFKDDLLRHGIKREVFLAPTAKNYKEFLRGEIEQIEYFDRSFSDLADFYVDRWMVPRSKRTSEWHDWTRRDTWDIISKNLGIM